MKTLPLLDYTANTFEKDAFKDIIVIGCQHFLHTNYLMFEKMFELGLKPEQTHLIGKSYSINPFVKELFLKRNVHVHTYEYDSHESFDEQFSVEIDSFLKSIQFTNGANQKILVIDDGANLLTKINTYFKGSVICGVEQTSSGYNALKDRHIDFPVINVARSHAKLLYESPFIAESVLEKLQPCLNKYIPQSALIIGAGPIGKNVYEQLSIPCKTIYDVATSSENLSTLLSSHELIIGCTGKTSVPKELHSYISPGSILVSASSSDREFDAVHLRKTVQKNSNPHLDVLVNGSYLVNSGFPVTFDGGIHGSLPEKIQLTQSLMLEGCYLATRATEHGLHDLDTSIQQDIISTFKKIRGES